uniref:Glycosyltransferase n=1 Tax=viral metagenome TaxID=1070528 RepID=A0A6C0LSB5_9ZZZZ
MILTEEQPIYTKDYYDYCVSLMERISKELRFETPILFKKTINANEKGIRILYNYEHTLVRKDGRDTAGAFDGAVPVLQKPDEIYLIRIVGLDQLKTANLIIEYSNPNIENIRSSFDATLIELAKKLIYIAPCLYMPSLTKGIRNNQVMTTFINDQEPRRKKLLYSLMMSKVSCTNVNNCFTKKKVQDLYLKTKILINIHQTEHHHTFEELRVLPALLNGTIVISELSPLSDLVPYAKCVVWVPYEKIVSTVKDVLARYDEVHKQIFGSIENRQILEGLDAANYESLKARLQDLV